MKIGAQVYVRGSVAAAKMYCEAFGAEVTLAIKDENGNYEHSELALDGQFIMNVSEAPADCDTSPKIKWQTMAFNAYPLGDKAAVQKAFDILSDGGTVLFGPGPRPWNEFCADVIDRYGVFWWLGL